MKNLNFRAFFTWRPHPCLHAVSYKKLELQIEIPWLSPFFQLCRARSNGQKPSCLQGYLDCHQQRALENLAVNPFAIAVVIKGGSISLIEALCNQEERPNNFNNGGGVILLTLAFDS